MKTTMKTRRRAGARAPRLATLSLLSLLAALCHSSEARAQWTSSGSNTTTTNNVGVGTASPEQVLHSHGGNEILSTGPGSGFKFRDRTSTTSANDWVWYSTGNVARFWRAGTGDLLSITPAGSVGIGTLAPEQTLHVNSGTVLSTGATAGYSFRSRGSVSSADDWVWYATDDVARFWRAGRGDLFTVSPTGRVGVGTATPNVNEPYSRFTTSSSDPTAVSTSIENTGVGQVGHAIRRVGGTPARWYQYIPPGSADLRFYQGYTGGSDTLTLQASGNVGVGTTAPAAKLHVAGDIRVDGNISAKYQDVAEWVPSTQKLAAGMVVVLDGGRINHVIASSTPYDTTVAGVVSAQPGIALGEAGEGKSLVATTGRVRVKVDATRGAIKVGDLLVTGETPGVAMRSQPLELGGALIHRPGTIIGKALEPLEKGTGEILVLLSLQ